MLHQLQVWLGQAAYSTSSWYQSCPATIWHAKHQITAIQRCRCRFGQLVCIAAAMQPPQQLCSAPAAAYTQALGGVPTSQAT